MAKNASRRTFLKNTAATLAGSTLIAFPHTSFALEGDEEPGVQYLAEWLQPQVPDVSVWHIPASDPFTPV